jgi:hypothetical protein
MSHKERVVMTYIDYVVGYWKGLARPDKGPRKVPAISQTCSAHNLRDLEYRKIQLEWLGYIEEKVFRFVQKGQQLESSGNAQQVRVKHINRALK